MTDTSSSEIVWRIRHRQDSSAAPGPQWVHHVDDYGLVWAAGPLDAQQWPTETEASAELARIHGWGLGGATVRDSYITVPGPVDTEPDELERLARRHEGEAQPHTNPTEGSTSPGQIQSTPIN